MRHFDTIADWLVSSHLYEKHLFFYCLMGVFWFFMGVFTLDFNVEGFSSEQVLFFNMAWFIVVCGAFFFPLFWYRLILGKKNFLLKDRQKIQDELDAIDDEFYNDVYKYNAKMGSFPPNRLEVFCLGLLFSFMLFDVFYIGVWVSNQSALLWQPAWVDWCIGLIKDNLILPPIYQAEGFFILDFGEGLNSTVFKETFGDERALLAAPMGDTLLFYHFIRVATFIPAVFAVCMVLWKPLAWLGIDKIDPQHINGMISFIRACACAWSIVMGFFLILMSYFYVTSVEMFLLPFIDKSAWPEEFKLNGLLIFIAFSIKFFYGWFVFWKNVIINRFFK